MPSRTLPGGAPGVSMYAPGSPNDRDTPSQSKPIGADGKSEPATEARDDKAPKAGRVEFNKEELEAARRARKARVEEMRAAREAAEPEPTQDQNNAKDGPNATEQNNTPRSGRRR